MKWWHSLGVVVCLSSGGCATLYTGEPGVPLDASGYELPEGSALLTVRSRELKDLSSPHLPVLEVSFENRSSTWHEITAARLRVGNPEYTGRVQLPIGQPLHDWQVAAEQRQKVAAANQDTALEVLSFGALVVAAAGSTSDDETVQVASAGLGVAALGALTADHYIDRKHEAEELPKVPSNHLLAGSISIAPGAVVKRWALLYTPKRKDTTGMQLVLGYDLAKYGTQHVLLHAKPRPAPQRDQNRGNR